MQREGWKLERDLRGAEETRWAELADQRICRTETQETEKSR